jgi:hypothetical protein
MTPITQSMQFSTPQEMMEFSAKLHEWAEQLEDIARIEQYDHTKEEYFDASTLDTLITVTDA